MVKVKLTIGDKVKTLTYDLLDRLTVDKIWKGVKYSAIVGNVAEGGLCLVSSRAIMKSGMKTGYKILPVFLLLNDTFECIEHIFKIQEIAFECEEVESSGEAEDAETNTDEESSEE